MKFHHAHIIKIGNVLAILLLVGACNFKAYQNLTAKYNGYFYANLRLEEVNQAINDAYVYDYNDILKVYPDIDSAVVKSNKAKLDDAFTKASQLIDWHSASDYVDDGYIVAGKIRHLRGEFQLAVETFQYVNQTSDDDNAKHTALIALMRTYTDMGEMDNAEQVSDYLESAKLSDKNMADYRLMMAYFHQLQNNLQGIAQNLNEVNKIIKNKEERSRSNFILGQIYQRLGFDEEAYNYYKLSLTGNPPYELTFHAKLNMQQVNSSGNMEDIRKYYQALLKDGKNKEYLGHIYYEMGEFERKQNNYDLALSNYKEAVAVEAPQPKQQGLSFLRLGQLYYEQYENYELAQAYYDSTLSVLPKEEPGYENIQKRGEILTDVVIQLQVIHVNDSLLSLSEMNPISLEAYVDNYLIKKEKLEKAKAKKETESNVGVNTVDRPSGNLSNDNSGKWYFYNAAAIDQGIQEFERVWGNRPLEDNWRRSQKERDLEGSNNSSLLSNADTIIQDGDRPTVLKGREAERAKLIQRVPKTEEDKDKLHSQKEEAYFKLGSIYQFGLEKREEAVNTYQILIDRYPESEFRPQAMFALYTLFKDNDLSKANTYKEQIIAEYPETLMAKTLINPDYLKEKEERNKELQRIYANAYYQYEQGNYKEAENTLLTALNTIEDVDFLPNAKLLLAILKAKTENIFSYEKALKNFLIEEPTGKLHDYAKKLLKAINPVKSTLVKNEDFEYSEDFEQLHISIMLFKTDQINLDSLKEEMEGFNSTNFSGRKLTLGTLEFDKDKKQVVLFVNSFSTKEMAMTYNEQLQEALKKFKSSGGKDFDNFVISRDNFQMLYQSKQVEEYRNFYKRFYR